MSAIALFSFQEIATQTGITLGVDAAKLKGRSRARRFVYARDVAVFLARQLTPLSSTQLGEKLHRDHSTILASEKRARRLIRDSADFRADMSAVHAALMAREPQAVRARRAVLADPRLSKAPQQVPAALAATWV
jgi:chromosomal replication initiation ATPase DnaA